MDAFDSFKKGKMNYNPCPMKLTCYDNTGHLINILLPDLLLEFKVTVKRKKKKVLNKVKHKK